ncbi:hypothetical protein P9A54_gp68 [Xanthomonas phage vB_Xar_IVIA-DoCa10]|uniref:DUF2786 domain-containing protein n=1 Tax=Xanthomonas phage vB_Xar_IVIA-DoCa10 TaxID=2975529 RepID=A0A9X9NYQ0_9CAUD|nr:hypothetical protein P9A54_gp68 [Xanthomonas phage vB_Xar_IVIA-DoCa10]UYA99053.1 hypothetical protein IVIADoCa10_68 [Xanthomonas phage vB_Xar_IVIA-DoCa10]
MDADRRKRLTEKLKKCMALSKSPEPHEAAAALRQAQKIMAELGVTEDELDGLDTADVVVKTREGFGRCRTMSNLATMMERAFGVKAVFERNPGSAARLNVRYIGPKGRVMLAEYAHKVVWRAMQASWDDLLIRRPDMKGDSGKRQAFHIGWLNSVYKQISAIAPTEAEDRAIQRYCDKIYEYGVVQQDKFKKKELDGGAFHAGARAAADFTLHRPMEEQQAALEHIK